SSGRRHTSSKRAWSSDVCSSDLTINAQTLNLCKDGVRVLNFARGELVDTAAMLAALENGKAAQYFCDFPSEELLGVKGVYCTPQDRKSSCRERVSIAVVGGARES